MKKWPFITALLLFASVFAFPVTSAPSILPKGLPKSIKSPNIYYFSTSGNDVSDGLSAKTPKGTLSEALNVLTSGIPEGGIAILFKRGDRFYDFKTSFGFSYVRGREDRPVYIGAYGQEDQPKPVISDLIPSQVKNWQSQGNDLYRIKQYVDTTDDLTFKLFIDNIPLRKMPTLKEVGDNQYCVENGHIIVKKKDFAKSKIIETMQLTDAKSFLFENINYVTFDGLEFRGGDGGGSAGNTFAISAPSDHVSILNCAFHAFRGYCVSFGPTMSNLNAMNTNALIENTLIDRLWTKEMNMEYLHQVAGMRNGAGNQSSGGDGIVFVDNVDGAVVRGCTILNLSHSAIGNQISARAVGVNNILIEQSFMSRGVSNNGRGFAFCGPIEKSNNIVVRRNYFYNMTSGNHFGGYRSYVYSNIFDGLRLPETIDNFTEMSCIDTIVGPMNHETANTYQMQECAIVNNTFNNCFLPVFYSGEVTSDIVRDNTFTNNIVSGWSTPDAFRTSESWQQSYTLFNNGFWKKGGDGIVYWDQMLNLLSTTDLNKRPNARGNRWMPPDFVGGTGYKPENFRLQAYSPYTQGGIPFGDIIPGEIPAVDYFGKPFDTKNPSIGAIQFFGTKVTTPAPPPTLAPTGKTTTQPIPQNPNPSPSPTANASFPLEILAIAGGAGVLSVLTIFIIRKKRKK